MQLCTTFKNKLSALVFITGNIRCYIISILYKKLYVKLLIIYFLFIYPLENLIWIIYNNVLTKSFKYPSFYLSALLLFLNKLFDDCHIINIYI